VILDQFYFCMFVICLYFLFDFFNGVHDFQNWRFWPKPDNQMKNVEALARLFQAILCTLCVYFTFGGDEVYKLALV
jgi:hypothetical protein